MLSIRNPRRAFLALAAIALIAGLAAGRASAATPPAATPSSCPWVSSRAPIAHRVSTVIGQMSLADEITIVQGAGTSNPYVFYMPGIARLCIPPLGEEDGPGGVADGLTGVTQLPAGVALAATFDPGLARQYGQVIGAEELGKGAAVNLGPTVNIDRDPRWGRSFETFTEDPFLNSTLAVSEINGVQGTGEMSQIKHFDVYNQETNRNLPADNAIVTARTLHEIYQPAFEAAVKSADVASLMCSYSAINGAFACDNRQLETNILRSQWDFSGFMTSDYGALHATSGALDGTDQEQPFNQYFGTPLEQAVSSGQIPKAVLNTMVARILGQMFRFHLIGHQLPGTPQSTVTGPGHVAVADRVATASSVLLKNARSALPLPAANAGNVAVIGPAASVAPVYGGGGSAAVLPTNPISPLQGLQAAAGSGTHISYAQGLPADTSLPSIPASDLSPAYAPTGNGQSYTGTLTAPETGTYVLAITNPCKCYAPTYLSVNGRQLIDDPGTPPSFTFSAAYDMVAGQKYALSITGGAGSGGNIGGQSTQLLWATPSALAAPISQAVAAAKAASHAIVVVADNTQTEAADRLGLDLPSAQNELISAVTAANPNTTVVVDAGAPVAMPWLGSAAAVLYEWYPGEVNGTALAQVLFGQVSPGGHLPVTFPASLAQVPAASPAQFPGTGNRVLYSEGLDVGYRWYDARRIAPLFPFGFGLSYTSFAYRHLTVTPSSLDGTGLVRVSATITNTGARAGSDVAQVYLSDPASAGEPPRQLVSFKRVALAPGASARVTFTITPRDTWWWNSHAGGWSQSAGRYGVSVGDSSATADLPLRGGFRIRTTVGARQVRLQAPRRLRAGRPALVTVRLGAGGTATLPFVRLALQLPQGFTARALTRTSFVAVAPGASPVARFAVTPPRWDVTQNVTVHATAAIGPFASREAGLQASVR